MTLEKAGSFWFSVREDWLKYRLRVGGFFNGNSTDTYRDQVIPSNTLTWAVATYDGARCAYIAHGDGTHLVLDNSRARPARWILAQPSPASMRTWWSAPSTEGTCARVTPMRMQAFFNGTMCDSSCLTPLTQSQISSVISGSVASAGPGPWRPSSRSRS
jgi:hypothetical protein